MTEHPQAKYWSFYWPLALTGLVMILARQFENGVLARYPDGTRELAIFALASSMLAVSNAAMVFVPQMVNVLARNRRSARTCWGFVVGFSLAVTLPLAAIAWTPLGPPVVSRLFGLSGDKLAQVLHYIGWLTPMVAVNALRNYYTGMLVQARRTGMVTGLNMMFLAILIGLLLLGRVLDLSAVRTVAFAQISASLVHWGLSWWLYRRLHRFPDAADDTPISLGEVWAFFWPASVTSILFAFSRPVIFSFVNRLPDAEANVAAMRVAFDFGFFFHNPCNQFRHLFVTFGRHEEKEIRRFMVYVVAGLVGLMLLVVATPVVGLVFRHLLKVTPDVASLARSALFVLCLTPIVISFRNYFHGKLMVNRRTGGMAWGAVGRIGTIAAMSWLLYAVGWLNPAWGSAVLVCGFAAEAVGSAAAFRISRARRMPPDELHGQNPAA